MLCELTKQIQCLYIWLNCINFQLRLGSTMMLPRPRRLRLQPPRHWL